jgi:hypothetical protein
MIKEEERMGLLTDPNNRQRGALTQFILSHHTKLSWLCFLAGGFKLLSEHSALSCPLVSVPYLF